MLELIRTPAEIGKELAQFRADAIALEERYEELAKAHPKHWAGMRRGELKIASTIEEVLHYFGDSRNVAMRFLDLEPKTWILPLESAKTLPW